MDDNMKKSQLRKIIKEEIANLQSGGWSHPISEDSVKNYERTIEEAISMLNHPNTQAVMDESEISKLKEAAIIAKTIMFEINNGINIALGK